MVSARVSDIKTFFYGTVRERGRPRRDAVDWGRKRVGVLMGRIRVTKPAQRRGLQSRGAWKIFPGWGKIFLTHTIAASPGFVPSQRAKTADQVCYAEVDNFSWVIPAEILPLAHPLLESSRWTPRVGYRGGLECVYFYKER